MLSMLDWSGQCRSDRVGNSCQPGSVRLLGPSRQEHHEGLLRDVVGDRFLQKGLRLLGASDPRRRGALTLGH